MANPASYLIAQSQSQRCEDQGNSSYTLSDVSCSVWQRTSSRQGTDGASVPMAVDDERWARSHILNDARHMSQWILIAFVYFNMRYTAPLSLRRWVRASNPLRRACTGPGAPTLFHFGELMKSTSVYDAYTIAKNIFEENGVSDSDDSSRHLIMKAGNLGTKLSDFHSASRLPLKDEVKQNFVQMINRRLNREPVQYIIGEWDFFGRTFACESPVLIPRPETEELVELIMARLRHTQSVNILDIGSGTGAIGISLLKELRQKCGKVTAIDINPQAVRLSKANADNILSSHERTKFECLLSPISDFARNESNFYSCDIIVSNPPYVPSKVVAGLQPEILNFEDKVALDGGDDGLDVVREILCAGRNLLSPNGTREIWLEVSEVHPEQIKELCAAGSNNPQSKDDIFLHYECLESIKDFSGNFRFSRLRLILEN